MKSKAFLYGSLLLAITPLLLAGCGGGGSSTPGPSASTVTNTGATLQPNASLKMVFDPEAVTNPTNVTVQAATPAVAAPQGQGVVPGTTYDFGPTGTVFAKPVHVSVTYDVSKLTPGTDQSTLQLHTIQNGAWSQDGISHNTVNTTTHTITADISHFSTFGVLGTVINQFAGTYSGTYTGNGPNGPFNGTVDDLTVKTDGTLTVSADGGAETGAGTVSPTGQTTLSASGSGSAGGDVAFTFTGTFQMQNGAASASGTFKDNTGDSGNWSVSRASSPSARPAKH